MLTFPGPPIPAPPAPPERAGPAITVLNFCKYEKNSLKAFCDLHLPSGLIPARLHAAPDCGALVDWASLKAYTGTAGAAKWQPIIDFESRERKGRLRRLATAAVASGEVTPREAAEIASLVEIFVHTLEANEFERRLLALGEPMFRFGAEAAGRRTEGHEANHVACL